jgi:hypothetical protein
MIESDAEDQRGCWKDIIILLRGNLRSGATASQVLADVIKEEDLPDSFHQICTSYLTAAEWMTRTNAGITIKNLCQKYSSQLSPLLSRSKSDGELLTLLELDVTAVSECKGAELLGGNSKCDSVEDNDLYSKNWLKRQRKALRKRLGLEAFTEDAVIAVDYVSLEIFLDDNDFMDDSCTKSDLETGGADTGNLMSSSTAHTAAPTTSFESKEEIEENIPEISTETWFARLEFSFFADVCH